MEQKTQQQAELLATIRKASEALAVACSYRDITRSPDGARILAALELTRETFSRATGAEA